MRVRRNLFLFFLPLIGLTLANADAEPEAEAEADANAPMYMPNAYLDNGKVVSNPMPGIPNAYLKGNTVVSNPMPGMPNAYLDGNTVVSNPMPGMPNAYLNGNNVVSKPMPYMPNAYLDNNNNVVSNNPFMVGPRPNCNMGSACCETSKEGCCVNDKKCYTTYTRVCSDQSKPSCRTMNKNVCVPYLKKSCRVDQTYKTVVVPVSKCTTKREKKCWDYTKNVCNRKAETKEENVTYTEESIVDETTKDVEKCFDVTKCNIVDDVRIVNKRVPERVCKKVPVNRRVCKTVPVPQPARKETKIMYDTVYRPDCRQEKVCQDMPAQGTEPTPCSQATSCQEATVIQPNPSPCDQGPSCQAYQGVCTSACQGGSYGGGYNPGSNGGSGYNPGSYGGGGYNPGNNGGGGYNDGSNGGGGYNEGSNSGGGYNPGNDGGGCYQGNSMQCCRYETKCIQRPVKVPRTVTVMVQPPPIYRNQCDVIVVTNEICRMETVTKQEKVPIKRCETVRDKECVTFSVPEQRVESEDKSSVVTVPYESCDITEERGQHCATVDVGVECGEENIRQNIRVSRQVCDRQQTKQVCQQIPYSNCENSGGNVCNWVPKQVCQDSCSDKPRCNQCSQFVSQGGFGSCTMNQCSNFIPKDAAEGSPAPGVPAPLAG